MYTVSDNFHSITFDDIIMALEYYDSLKGGKCNCDKSLKITKGVL